MTLQELTTIFTPEQIALFSPAQIQALLGASTRRQTKEKTESYVRVSDGVTVACTPEQKANWTAKQTLTPEQRQANKEAGEKFIADMKAKKEARLAETPEQKQARIDAYHEFYDKAWKAYTDATPNRTKEMNKAKNAEIQAAWKALNK